MDEAFLKLRGMKRRTLQRMLRASEHERQLVAYDIHDGLAQELAGAILQLQSYAEARQRDPMRAADAFEAGMALLIRSHGEARRLIRDVRPPILAGAGIAGAVASLVRDAAHEDGPKIEFCNRLATSRLPPMLENAIYRIVQEALANVRKHSKSATARVTLEQRDNRVQVRIRDWGIGFDCRHTDERGVGLAGIRERARLLGGRWRIHSRPGRGTLLSVEFPVEVWEDEAR